MNNDESVNPIPDAADQRRSLLLNRRSTPARQLSEPAPDSATLMKMLSSASRVPDHGRREPFRFIAIEGQARQALGEELARITLAADPDATPAAIEKDQQRFTHAPLVVAVVAVLDEEDTRIPEQERLLTAGCVCFSLLLAAQAEGFGAQWLTGWPAYDRNVANRLGLSEQERIAGFIHIGTPTHAAPERERPDTAALLTTWQP
ncbi:nitroreductase family protein [Luteimonas qiangzhengi]|uniref:nitroreductase family protein n=1 Tax=Luteimonas sp. MJ146 TaxID=3129240 RepID=UPI0031BAEEEF